MSSPHLYEFNIHSSILSEADTIFEEFNTRQFDYCCVPRPFWGMEYKLKDLPPLLDKLKEYVYNELVWAGFQVKQTGWMTLAEYIDTENHVTPPPGMFRTPGFRQIGVVLVFQKSTDMYDSGLTRTEKVPLKNPVLKNFSYEKTYRADLLEGVGVMYHQPHAIEYIGGTGRYRFATLLFDQK
jgi:hypothetical protein